MDSTKSGNSLTGSFWALEVAYGIINGVVKISFTSLRDLFWDIHDPTDKESLVYSVET